jgi:hypothetical protein
VETQCRQPAAVVGEKIHVAQYGECRLPDGDTQSFPGNPKRQDLQVRSEAVR